MGNKIPRHGLIYIFLRPSGAELTRVVLDQRMTDCVLVDRRRGEGSVIFSWPKASDREPMPSPQRIQGKTQAKRGTYLSFLLVCLSSF